MLEQGHTSTRDYVKEGRKSVHGLLVIWTERNVKDMDEMKLEKDPIPEFETLKEIAEFWDTHCTADYDDLTHGVHFEVNLQHQHEPAPILILPELGETLAALAKARGISVETLVNVWLTEKVLELR